MRRRSSRRGPPRLRSLSSAANDLSAPAVPAGEERWPSRPRCGDYPRSLLSLFSARRSYNYYARTPLSPRTASRRRAGDWRTVFGERSLTFCPRHPQAILQFSTVEEILANSQREFWAMELTPDADSDAEQAMREKRFGLETAEKDGTLYSLGSTYSAENQAVYDGIARPGVRLVTFAPILKHGVFPLASARALLDVGVG